MFVPLLFICILEIHSVSSTANVLVVAGEKEDRNTESVEMFDYKANRWHTATKFPVALRGVRSATLNGLVYATGGRYYDGNAVRKTFVYSPSKKVWTSVADMKTARVYHAVAAFAGKIYAIGGAPQLRSTEAFDPYRNQWAPLASMQSSRTDFAVGVLGGYLYALGGESNGTQVLKSVERYDSMADVWFSVGNMKTARTGHCAAVVNGKLYVVGGKDENYNFLRSAEVYDIESNEWTPLGALSGVRYGGGAVALEDRIYVIGGYDGYRYLTFVEVYDPKKAKWSVLNNARMSTGRKYFGVAILSASGTISASSATAFLGLLLLLLYNPK